MTVTLTGWHPGIWGGQDNLWVQQHGFHWQWAVQQDFSEWRSCSCFGLFDRSQEMVLLWRREETSLSSLITTLAILPQVLLKAPCGWSGMTWVIQTVIMGGWCPLMLMSNSNQFNQWEVFMIHYHKGCNCFLIQWTAPCTIKHGKT